MRDLILNHAYGKPSVAVQGIDGNPEEIQRAITELHNEGLVRIQSKGHNRGKTSILTYQITDHGTQLVNNGGYAKSKRRAIAKNLSRNILNSAWAIVLLIIGAVIDRIISILF